MHEDAEFMTELHAAMKERGQIGSRVLVYVIAITVIWCIVWARYAMLDEVARGMGKIIPFSKVQVVQNLEGGIVSEILVKAGDLVDKGQMIVKIDNKNSEGSYEENSARLENLRITCARAQAEIDGTRFTVDPVIAKKHADLVKSEQMTFSNQAEQLTNQEQMTAFQIDQKRQEVRETQSRIRNTREGMALLQQQLSMMRPLVERKVESEVELLKLEREASSIRERLESATDSLPRLESAINELERKKADLKMSYKSHAQKELTDALLEINQIEKKQAGLKDQVTRTVVRSPVRGIVKQVDVTTVGGVVKPGMDLVEIVPVDDNLIAEVRVRPADIAFLHPGLAAIVKITAYDFGIYGGLPGKVVNIGADSTSDDHQQVYFPVLIRTERNYLGSASKPLPIIPGMTVTADILTGKKSVLHYLVKPILKMKANALTER